MTHIHHHHHHHHGHNESDSGLGCFFMLVLGLLATPLVGLYLLAASPDEDSKVLGMVLLIVGIVVWVFALASGA